MREAVIVDTARTAIGKAYRGAFNNTEAPALGAHVIRAMMARQDIDPALIDDVVMGCRHDYRPPVRLRHDGHCHSRQINYVQRIQCCDRRWC